MILYHFTPKQTMPSIEAEGIQPYDISYLLKVARLLELLGLPPLGICCWPKESTKHAIDFLYYKRSKSPEVTEGYLLEVDVPPQHTLGYRWVRDHPNDIYTCKHTLTIGEKEIHDIPMKVVVEPIYNWQVVADVVMEMRWRT